MTEKEFIKDTCGVCGKPAPNYDYFCDECMTIEQDRCTESGYHQEIRMGEQCDVCGKWKQNSLS